MTAGLGDLERVRTQSGIVRDVDVGLLARPSRLPADEPADRLTEEQLGGGGGGEHADAQPGDVDALGHHSHRHQPRPVVVGELGDLLRGGRIVADHHVGRRAETVAQQPGDALCVVLVDGDHQSAGVAVVLADRTQLLVGACEHARHPLALEAQRGSQPHRHLVLGQLVLEAGVDHVARRRGPLHVAVDAREVHRSHDAAVAQGIRVAVGEVGVSHVALAAGGVVAHERDLYGVTAKWCARQRQAPGGVSEGRTDAVAPGLLVAGMVDLVEDHEPVGRQPGELGRSVARGDLLVRGDEAVHVACEALAGAPIGIELQPQAMCRERPLHLEVAGRQRPPPACAAPRRGSPGRT